MAGLPGNNACVNELRCRTRSFRPVSIHFARARGTAAFMLNIGPNRTGTAPGERLYTAGAFKLASQAHRPRFNRARSPLLLISENSVRLTEGIAPFVGKTVSPRESSVHRCQGKVRFARKPYFFSPELKFFSFRGCRVAATITRTSRSRRLAHLHDRHRQSSKHRKR
jgi:hypothetical protein